jgi:hypothetical protein
VIDDGLINKVCMCLVQAIGQLIETGLPEAEVMVCGGSSLSLTSSFPYLCTLEKTARGMGINI